MGAEAHEEERTGTETGIGFLREDSLSSVERSVTDALHQET